jgi:hypothetical protein
VAICGFDKNNCSIIQHFERAGNMNLKMPVFNIQNGKHSSV